MTYTHDEIERIRQAVKNDEPIGWSFGHAIHLSETSVADIPTGELLLELLGEIEQLRRTLSNVIPKIPWNDFGTTDGGVTLNLSDPD